MNSLETRVAVLESQLARSRRLALVGVLLAAAVLVLGFDDQAARQEASEFVVVDRLGEVRARLTETGLYLMDETGREALALSFANSRGDWSPGLSFYYPSAQERRLSSRMTLHREPDGGVNLVMNGGSGAGGVTISVSETGETSIVARSPDGDELWRPF